MKNKIKRIHMIGIGGAGMCGIAEILLREGFEVSGSDMAEGSAIERLRKLGASIAKGHAPQNVRDAQVVVKSTAIANDNPEVQEARRRGIPIIPRAEMLAELMRLRTGIAVAGTHGKTTTTSLTASIFDQANLDPTVIIGGRINVYGTNAHLGAGNYLIAEADESDGSFLCLFSIINIVTNIDNDHLDHYGSREAIDEAFLEFMNKVPFYGLNVVCGDDPGIRKLLPQIKRPVMTYGFGPENDLRGVIHHLGPVSQFEVWREGEKLGLVSLGQPGRHNVLNALGAIGASLASDIPFSICAEGLSNFKGVGRRFEFKGEKSGVTVIDDYGHHPAELASTLRTAREVFPGRRLVAAFQPHRYTRTKALYKEFCGLFDGVDMLLLTEIYPASEQPIAGISGEILASDIRDKGAVATRFFPTLDEMVAGLDTILQPGDVLLTLGAGSITRLGPAWLEGRPNA